jgi:hypothetical protein
MRTEFWLGNLRRRDHSGLHGDNIKMNLSRTICEGMDSIWADHSSRGILPIMVCLSVIVKPQ